MCPIAGCIERRTVTIRIKIPRAAKRAGVAAGAAAAALLPTVVLAPSASADVPVICNVGSIGIGVVHFVDGTYTNGNYDAILYKGQCTSYTFGWGSAGGFYVGSGYTVNGLAGPNLYGPTGGGTVYLEASH